MSSIEELRAYQKSLMVLLRHIPVEKADAATVKALEKTYELLRHLTPEQSTTESLESLRFLLGGK